ncbi:hypothetical protein D9M70_388740 [compost metagenome]
MVEFAPEPHALFAFGAIVPFGRMHGDVLRHPHSVIGMVGPHTMGKQAVEDHQVACLHLDVDSRETGHVGVHRVAVSRLGLLPAFEVFEEFRHALEAADVAILLLQAQHALNADRQRPDGGIDVPMDEPVGIALHLLRRVEVGAVDRHPQVLAVPDVDEGAVDARLLPVVPEILVIVDLQHAGVVEFLHLVLAPMRRIPGRRIVRILLVEAPEQVDKALDIGRRHPLAHDDIAPGDPVLPVRFRKHAQRQPLLDVLQLYLEIGSRGVAVSERLHECLLALNVRLVDGESLAFRSRPCCTKHAKIDTILAP